jgi:acyl-CoA synthetase (AMP-forming)/AMP-acid ligase II
MITHGNMIPFVQHCAECFKITPQDKILNTIPLHLDSCVVDIFGHVAGGASNLIRQGFVSVRSILSVIDKQQVTFLWTSPFALQLFCDESSDLSRYSLHSLRLIATIGSPLPVKPVVRLKSLAPQAEFFNCYGPTEATVMVTYYRTADPTTETRKALPIGKAIPTTEVLVVDETGAAVAAGQVGELVIRGDNIMKGYWNAPALTAKALPHNPWPPPFDGKVYYTGDLVELLPGGELYFIGRKDNQIKTRGGRIELEEIDLILGAQPGVKDAAAIAIPDSLGGQQIAAFLVCEHQRQQELRQALGRILPPHMIPQYWIFVDSLQRSPLGKIDRRALLEEFQRRSDLAGGDARRDSPAI